MNGPIRADRGEVIRIFSFQTLATCCATLTTPTARSGWESWRNRKLPGIAARNFRSMTADALKAMVARDARRTRFVPE